VAVNTTFGFGSSFLQEKNRILTKAIAKTRSNFFCLMIFLFKWNINQRQLQAIGIKREGSDLVPVEKKFDWLVNQSTTPFGVAIGCPVAGH